jgi:hypothetical protein
MQVAPPPAPYLAPPPSSEPVPDIPFPSFRGAVALIVLFLLDVAMAFPPLGKPVLRHRPVDVMAFVLD